MLDGAKGAVVVDYRGLTVEQDTQSAQAVKRSRRDLTRYTRIP